MKYEILPSGNLRIYVDAEEQAELNSRCEEQGWRFDSDDFMYEVLEPIVSNSELEWVRPEHCDALTSAPILGIYGPERIAKDGETFHDTNLVGSWPDEQGVMRRWAQDVTECWGFMYYELRSPQQGLAERGESIWQKGE